MFLIVVAISACDRSTICDTTEEISDEIWHETDTLTGKFEITDSTHYYDVFVNARFNALYPFSNIYFKAILTGPGGQRMTTVKTFAVTDKSGKWLGSGYGNLHSYSFPVFQDLAVKQMGTYRMKVIPYMRVPKLEGIHDRGVKVTIGKEIF